MYRLAIPAALLALAACATTPADREREAQSQAEADQQIAHELRGLTPGKPMACIDQTRARSSKTFRNTILYEYSSREVYRNDTSGGCFGLAHDDTIVSRTPGTQLCRGDIIRTVDLPSGTPSGSCALGDFIPYRR